MEIDKSTRHAKIVGDFGEQLVCNWLSRSGWEVVLVDHTGIDLIAYHKQTGKRIGISNKNNRKRNLRRLYIKKEKEGQGKGITSL